MRFGRLSVSYDAYSEYPDGYSWASCSCGNPLEVLVHEADLLSGAARCCGECGGYAVTYFRVRDLLGRFMKTRPRLPQEPGVDSWAAAWGCTCKFQLVVVDGEHSYLDHQAGCRLVSNFAIQRARLATRFYRHPTSEGDPCRAYSNV
jgi:hypothetical protein